MENTKITITMLPTATTPVQRIPRYMHQGALSPMDSMAFAPFADSDTTTLAANPTRRR